ncbi:MAG: hypothetical protein MJE77_28450 [Proteobacteria bacterium]|nr:hypothetical protein [Pseudomonadota bacterium]
MGLLPVAACSSGMGQGGDDTVRSRARTSRARADRMAGRPAGQDSGTSASNRQRPYGWAAYPDRRITGVAGLGPAPDAAVVDHEGRPVRLASLWAAHNVALVFYRGHW